MNKEFREILAALYTKLAINKAKICANPLPYLERAGKQMALAEKCFHDLEVALSSDYVFGYAENMKIPPMNINGEALIRCNRAKDVLHTYFSSRDGE